jgi:hypothetical protein
MHFLGAATTSLAARTTTNDAGTTVDTKAIPTSSSTEFDATPFQRTSSRGRAAADRHTGTRTLIVTKRVTASSKTTRTLRPHP